MPERVLSRRPAQVLRIKRAYEPASPADGARVLVDRWWPRGVRKEAARLTTWARNVAPSATLCAWYGHDPARFGAFRARYRAELEANTEGIREILEVAGDGVLTLVFGAREVERSNAAVLREFLAERLRSRSAGVTPRRPRARRRPRRVSPVRG